MTSESLVLFLLMLLNLMIVQSSVTISKTHNRFEIHVSGKVTQSVYDLDKANKSVAFEASLDHMQLLRSARIFAPNQSSCIVREPEDAGANYKDRKVQRDVNASLEGISFEETAEKLGIHHVHREYMATRPRCIMDFIIPTLNSSRTIKLQGEFCVPEHLTGGAAVGDYDNDGMDDIYFTVFHSAGVLYRNNGDNTFTDVTRESGIGPARYGNGASWSDVDQDGDLDLYVTTVGDTRHYLYINHGGWFEEEALLRNCSLQFPSLRKLAGMSANFGDFDNDGYPDLYVTEWILHTLGKPSASRLLRNRGPELPGYFEDVTESYGVNMDAFNLEHYDLSSGTYSFASSFTDFDNDGKADLLVTADFGESRMFWNMGQNRSFWECTEHCGLRGEQDAMGHAIGDWNNDGLMDWFSSAIIDDKTNCEIVGCTFDDGGNKLFQNLGRQQFADITEQAGVADGGWGWGAAFLDYNNDGYQDIVMTNGIDFPTTTTDDHFGKQRMRLWQNVGTGETKEVSAELGMNSTQQGRGLLKWDLDDDGDIDVIVCNNIGRPEIFENLGGNKTNFWIKVKVMHRCKKNPGLLCDSLGARVEVKQDNTGLNQTQEIGSNTHFLAQSETRAHFGLGSMAKNVTVHVTWPTTGSQIYIRNVPVNTRLKVIQPENDMELTEYSLLETCPTLKITEILTQPKNGSVEINPDGRSARFIKNSMETIEELGVQEFSYEVQMFPNNSKSVSVVHSAMIYVVEEQDCFNGKPVEYEELKPTDERRYDGISNNKRHLMWGAANENLHRLTSSAYSDGVATPASVCTAEQRNNHTCAYSQEYSSYGSTRPSPRVISNELFRQTQPIISKRKINDFHVHFGQFLSHDTDLTTTLPRFEFQENFNDVWLPISVPKGDVHFDLGDPDSSYLPFVRSIYNRCTGRETGVPREQINVISSYIDGNMIYGSNAERNKILRTLSRGRLKVWEQEMLPLNTFGVANANDVGRVTKRLFLAGDTRANIQPGLTAVHTVFVREHNRLCDEYLIHKPSASDEEVFQYARKMVIAELQAITFREYLPSLLGGADDIQPYSGYHDHIDATADQILTTSAFRFGHSQVNSLLWRLDEQGEVIPEGHLPLRDAYFTPERIINEGGIDPILRGSFAQPAQQVDTKMVDDVRNFLFALNRRGQDLTSINIQRGRDHGVPDLNTVRVSIGLPKYKSFEEITGDKEISSTLEQLYHNIDNVDLWVGGLAEEHQKGELGPTFRKIVLDSFTRIRDGDRFWYKNGILSPKEIKLVENLTLSEIIRLNTNTTNVPRKVFYSTLHCREVNNELCVPYLNSSNQTSKCDPEHSTKLANQMSNLTQTVQELWNKSHSLENKLNLNEKQKENLTTQLTSLHEKYKKSKDECGKTGHSENNIVTLVKENKELKNEVNDLKKSAVSGSERSVNDRGLQFEIIVLVLVGVLALSTITFGVLYVQARRKLRRLSAFQSEDDVSIATKTTRL